MSAKEICGKIFLIKSILIIFSQLSASFDCVNLYLYLCKFMEIFTFFHKSHSSSIFMIINDFVDKKNEQLNIKLKFLFIYFVKILNIKNLNKSFQKKTKNS